MMISYSLNTKFKQRKSENSSQLRKTQMVTALLIINLVCWLSSK